MNRKMIAGFLAALMMMGAVAGCSNSTGSRSNNDDPAEKQENSRKDKAFEAAEDADYDEDDMYDNYLEFVTAIYSNCAEAAGDANMMISPASILFALEMTAGGAAGDTLDQMTNVLVPGADSAEALRFGSDYMAELQDAGEDMLGIANAVWINSNVANYVFDDYLEYVQENFLAECEVAPFNQDTTDEINEWVNDNTHGMIERILENPLNDDNAMVLVNAIVFEGLWEDQYEEEMISPDCVFYAYDGSSENVTMLDSTEYTFIQNDLCTGFLKNYEGGRFAFMAMLPTDYDMTGNELAQAMTAGDYTELWNSRTDEYEVVASIPEFTADFEIDISEVLQEMGMEDAFDAYEADFGNMIDMGDDNVFISNVLHKTHIEVDSNGTRAAAVTAVMMDVACCEPEEDTTKYVILNRPFSYAIVDTVTGMPVFIGTVNSIG